MHYAPGANGKNITRQKARADAEIYGLFSVLLPQRARESLDARHFRKRQGLVPDLKLAFPLVAGDPDCEALLKSRRSTSAAPRTRLPKHAAAQ